MNDDARGFVVLVTDDDEQIIFLDNPHHIAEAQDIMVEEGIESAIVHCTDGSCSNYGNHVILSARCFVAIPYTKTYADDHGESTYCLIRARDKEHAIDLISARGGSTMNDECWWSKEANKLGDTAERSDGNCHYMMWSCDCGDSDCYSDEDGRGQPHDPQTETIIFRFEEARVYSTYEAAIAANNDRDPAVEYLET